MHLATRLSVPALCLSALTVHADTLTVCLDGTCDFTDIQVAIIAASEGDVHRAPNCSVGLLSKKRA